jgi:hypothetical protein
MLLFAENGKSQKEWSTSFLCLPLIIIVVIKVGKIGFYHGKFCIVQKENNVLRITTTEDVIR